MLIGNKLEYALKILIELVNAQDQGLIPSRHIAEKCGIPTNFMPQITSVLTKKGWVISSRGPGGGLRISAVPGELTVLEVMEALDNRLTVKDCLFADRSCSQSESCPLFPLWKNIQHGIQEVVKNTTIADLVKDKLILEQRKSMS
ncbi:RrF2 family transcriptional regulator [Candidatus Contubernalis alkaliaceticus]|uniref:RrF2 family transcriptional regulator n=1 Tax=Candidatus Contubernalis alkaliaceticus TaxID=338645 RepID=UPI001F4C3B04|nr:Rrf2 family transcriptional regulator [Candidatus Contubernalis alkalaceticus]UNC91621.1 Rrf2 family transcriptional regulator [Candidatus Contubernalis alkalaceticus]